jgi:MerR family transcriptional regulator, repressor of the yfmOP operon
MSAAAPPTSFRIGELARRAGATPRTVRYYEELGLLPAHGRAPARHRLYDADDETRLRELLRLREILGLSLADLRAWVDADAARARLRERWHGGDVSDQDRLAILREALQHLTVQLTLVNTRRAALEELEDELVTHRRRLRSLMHELEGREAP